jgi:nucleoside-diphosphate-sugar epimerase
MKIILTGSTGFIGSEVLLQALRHPHITSVVALSRRPLPIDDPKLTTVLLDDFTRFPESAIKQLEGATGCVWYVVKELRSK